MPSKFKPTETQMQQALDAMRNKRAFAHFPSSLEAAIQDPWRAVLINLNARAVCIQQARQPGKNTNIERMHAAGLIKQRPLASPGFDIKRAAAGDRDD